MKRYILGFLLFLLIINFAYLIHSRESSYELIKEMDYFPSGTGIRILAIGFHEMFADMIWLRFIQYYGEHRMTDVRFEHLFHILDILTTLDPHFIHAYTLGGLLLAHSGQDPDNAKRLLKRGMISNPANWRIPFYYAFMHYMFTKDYRTAVKYFQLSARKPNASNAPGRWAAFITYKKVRDLKSALAMWIELYTNAQDREEQLIAEMYIRNIKMKLDLQFLNERIVEFKEKIGREPFIIRELVIYGIIKEVPEEPHGELYIIKNGRAISTWQQERPYLFNE
jgi:hypothetical protein